MKPFVHVGTRGHAEAGRGARGLFFERRFFSARGLIQRLHR